jgi:ganglioside GM2 activator
MDYDNDMEDYLRDLVERIRANWNESKPVDQRLLWQSHEDIVTRSASFYWSDCGGSQDIGHVTSMTLSPVPLRIPGNIQLGFTLKLTSAAKAPISVVVEIKKKITFVYVKVKTLRLDDICAVLEKTECPPEFTNCHCPFSKGVYSFPSTLLTVGQLNIPGGSYHITTWFNQGSQQLGCLYLELSVA